MTATLDYFIYYINVYQCKNMAKVDIDDVLKSFPTTKKTVANVIFQSGITKIQMAWDTYLETLLCMSTIIGVDGQKLQCVWSWHTESK